MKTREVILASGERFTVPQGIQRLDSKSTHGWQVRYQGNKYFSDGTEGPTRAFESAVHELLRRIDTLPAPTSLKRVPSPNKTSSLPVGISGPIVLTKAGSKSQAAVLSVVVPRYGQPTEIREIHIGTPATYTKARYRAALAKAVALRNESTLKYQEDLTRARRETASEIKKALGVQGDA